MCVGGGGSHQKPAVKPCRYAKTEINEALKCKPSAHTVSLYIPFQISRQVVKTGWPGRDFTVKFYSSRVCWGTSQASSEPMDRVDGKKRLQTL